MLPVSTSHAGSPISGIPRSIQWASCAQQHREEGRKTLKCPHIRTGQTAPVGVLAVVCGRAGTHVRRCGANQMHEPFWQVCPGVPQGVLSAMGVFWQSSVRSQTSAVHSLKSSQAFGMASNRQLPSPLSQESAVQSTWSLQTTGGLEQPVSGLQRSVVQALASSQSVSSGVKRQPFSGSQESTVQSWLSVH